MIVRIVSWIVFGLIVGAVARFLVPGDQSNSIFSAILLGIAGSFIGGYIGSLIFKDKEGGQGRLVEFGLSVAGAMILVILNKWFFHF